MFYAFMCHMDWTNKSHSTHFCDAIMNLMDPKMLLKTDEGSSLIIHGCDITAKVMDFYGEKGAIMTI